MRRLRAPRRAEQSSYSGSPASGFAALTGRMARRTARSRVQQRCVAPDRQQESRWLRWGVCIAKTSGRRPLKHNRPKTYSEGDSDAIIALDEVVGRRREDSWRRLETPESLLKDEFDLPSRWLLEKLLWADELEGGCSKRRENILTRLCVVIIYPWRSFVPPRQLEWQPVRCPVGAMA